MLVSPAVAGVKTDIVDELDILRYGRLVSVPILKRVFAVPNDIVAIDYIALFVHPRPLVRERRVVDFPNATVLHHVIARARPKFDRVPEPHAAPLAAALVLIAAPNPREIAVAYRYARVSAAAEPVRAAVTKVKTVENDVRNARKIDNVPHNGGFERLIALRRVRFRIEPYASFAALVTEVVLRLEVFDRPTLPCGAFTVEDDIADVGR